MTFKEFCKELLEEYKWAGQAFTDAQTEEYKGRYDGKVAVEIIKSLQ